MADTGATIVLDGVSFVIDRDTYSVEVDVKADFKATNDNGITRTGTGLWKKTFSCTIQLLAFTILNEAKTNRDILRAIMAKTTPIALTTPDLDVYSVYVKEGFTETFAFETVQSLGYEYKVEVSFIEA